MDRNIIIINTWSQSLNLSCRPLISCQESHSRFMECQSWNVLDRLPSFGFPSFLLLCLQLLKQRNSLLLNLLHSWLLAAQTQCAKRLHPARNWQQQNGNQIFDKVGVWGVGFSEWIRVRVLSLGGRSSYRGRRKEGRLSIQCVKKLWERYVGVIWFNFHVLRFLPITYRTWPVWQKTSHFVRCRNMW